MNRTTIILSLSVFMLSSCGETYTSKDYLKKVLNNLETIESATYRARAEKWNHGDTAATLVFDRYVESYRNPSDTTIGSSWAVFDNEQKTRLVSAYDGKMRAGVDDDVKEIVVDSFKLRQLPFRPVSPPFFNYTENIVRYIIENNDSTSLEQKELGEVIYVKLTIYEDRQVEFFGRAHYIPENPYTFDPTSIYELWIDKKTNLPQKVRREMSHDISVSSVSDCEFNKLRLENFVAPDYFPKDYDIRQYGENRGTKQPHELIGRKAPDWILPTSDNRDIALSELKSKALMIQFTSVSCGPCRASIPFLKELSKEYKNTDFDWVAIECTSKNATVLKSYMKRNDFNYTFLLSNEEVLKKYSITSFPVFFILDENRIITNVINGYRPRETDKEIRTAINDLISKHLGACL